MAMTALIVLAVILTLVYSSLILFYALTFKKSTDFTPDPKTGYAEMSVIIPFKNEEKFLPGLLEKIKAQIIHFPQVEVFLINAHSNDSSLAVAKSYQKNLPRLHVLSLPPGKSGKKEALKFGIMESSSEYALMTDADTSPGPEWIRIISKFIDQNKPFLASAPVRMIADANSFFQNLQALEFASLSGAGLASFISHSPIMCNAANLIVRKELFLEAFHKIQKDFHSGDDIFLLQYAKRKYPGKINYIKNPGATVNTFSEPDLQSFFKQRSRWASKSLLYDDPMLVFVALLVFLLNIMIPAFIIGIIMDYELLKIFIFIITMKAIADFIFLRQILLFYRQKQLLKFFLPAYIIYPFYILVTSISGFIQFFLQTIKRRS